MIRQRIVLGAVVVVLLPAIVVLANRVSSDIRADPVAPVITELMSSNGTTIADEDGDHRDWIELHNPSDAPLDLDGYFLSDDDDDPHRWQLPATTLDPGGFLLVWASGKDRAPPDGELHANFRIDREGEPLTLTAPDGVTVVDRVEAVEVPRDVSYGRDPADPGRWCYFVRPTPGAENDDDCRDAVWVGAPVLSAPSGFYDEPFELTISVPESDDTIYYTLDGSYPDPERNAEHTHVYEGPIDIVDRSDEPDRWTGIRTAFDRWEVPDEPVQKATVVRARTEVGEEAVATYFVGPELARPELPVISIASDGDHLFDHETGIYVPGAIYEAWESGPDFDPELRGWERPANHSQRGRAWERPPEDDLERSIALTFCEPGGACELTQNVGLRIHGGVSRTYEQKSLRLYARNDYGARTFEYPFFGIDGPDTHRRLILRNSGNDWARTMLLDGYLQSVASHMAMDTQAYRPAVLFLNGEYWGIHNIRERYDRHYLHLTHGVDPDEVVILERNAELDTGRPGDERPYLDLLEFVATHDPADPATLAEVERRLDLDNLIDYLVLQLFVSNTDWPGGNTEFWRVRVEPGTEPPGPDDGRWRWLTFDLDHAGDFRLDPEHDNLTRVATAVREDDLAHWSGIPLLLSRLLDNPEFEERFLLRFADHLNTTFLPERTVPELDRLEELLADEMEHHGPRWQQQPSVETWRARVDDIRSFMIRRPEQQWRQLVDVLGLAGTTELRVRTDPARGHVTVNTLDLRDTTPGVSNPADWTGTYPLGRSVTLRAEPAPGHRFVRWEGGADPDVAHHARIELTLEGPAELEAVFAPP